MNIELIESFGQNYPEEFDGVLDCISLSVTCEFNKWGTLLAVGCNDGRIVIWDFLTRGIAKIIMAHMHPVCSLSWSRNGKELLSASTDNNVCVWNVVNGEREEMYKFPSPVLKVQYHPKMENMFLVSPMKHAAVLIDTEVDHKIVPLSDDSDTMIVASFDRRGQYIYTGNARGKILILTCPDLEFKASFEVSSGIKSIEFSRKGNDFLLNCSDRVIRVYDAIQVLDINQDTVPIQKLQDLVNKTIWKKCCFSGDGEFICSGSARQHSLYIWEKSDGNLVKILHGTKGELMLDIVWHPLRAIITSISSGIVSVWAQNQVENWSAFSPEFKELDENIEYEERESEFDLEDEDRSIIDDAEHYIEDIDVDVEVIQPVAGFCSSDEEESEDYSQYLMVLPIAVDIEDPDPDTVQPVVTSTSKRRTINIHLDNTTNELHPLLCDNINENPLSPVIDT